MCNFVTEESFHTQLLWFDIRFKEAEDDKVKVCLSYPVSVHRCVSCIGKSRQEAKSLKPKFMKASQNFYDLSTLWPFCVIGFVLIVLNRSAKENTFACYSHSILLVRTSAP